MVTTYEDVIEKISKEVDEKLRKSATALWLSLFTDESFKYREDLELKKNGRTDGVRPIILDSSKISSICGIGIDVAYDMGIFVSSKSGNNILGQKLMVSPNIDSKKIKKRLGKIRQTTTKRRGNPAVFTYSECYYGMEHADNIDFPTSLLDHVPDLFRYLTTTNFSDWDKEKIEALLTVSSLDSKSFNSHENLLVNVSKLIATGLTKDSLKTFIKGNIS